MPKDTDKAIWLEENEFALVNLILQYKASAPTLPFLVTISKCREISEKLHAEFRRIYTPKQVSNKIHNLRNITKQYYNIKTKETGIGWNVEYECPEADEDRWAALKEKYPDCNNFKRRSCHHFQQLIGVWQEQFAKGKKAISSTRTWLMDDDTNLSFASFNQDVPDNCRQKGKRPLNSNSPKRLIEGSRGSKTAKNVQESLGNMFDKFGDMCTTMCASFSVGTVQNKHVDAEGMARRSTHQDAEFGTTRNPTERSNANLDPMIAELKQCMDLLSPLVIPDDPVVFLATEKFHIPANRATFIHGTETTRRGWLEGLRRNARWDS